MDKNTKFATRVHSSVERFATHGMRSRRSCLVHVRNILSSCTISSAVLPCYCAHTDTSFQYRCTGAASGENETAFVWFRVLTVAQFNKLIIRISTSVCIVARWRDIVMPVCTTHAHSHDNVMPPCKFQILS